MHKYCIVEILVFTIGKSFNRINKIQIPTKMCYLMRLICDYHAYNFYIHAYNNRHADQTGILRDCIYKENIYPSQSTMSAYLVYYICILKIYTYRITSRN